jgi:hypothetical protein
MLEFRFLTRAIHMIKFKKSLLLTVCQFCFPSDNCFGECGGQNQALVLFLFLLPSSSGHQAVVVLYLIFTTLHSKLITSKEMSYENSLTFQAVFQFLCP